MSNNTRTDRIFSQSEREALVASYRDDMLLKHVPLALGVVERNLKSRRPDPLLATAILEGAQVLVRKPEHGPDGSGDRFAKMTDDELNAFIDSGRQNGPPLDRP